MPLDLLIANLHRALLFVLPFIVPIFVYAQCCCKEPNDKKKSKKVGSKPRKDSQDAFASRQHTVADTLKTMNLFENFDKPTTPRDGSPKDYAVGMPTKGPKPIPEHIPKKGAPYEVLSIKFLDDVKSSVHSKSSGKPGNKATDEHSKDDFKEVKSQPGQGKTKKEPYRVNCIHDVANDPANWYSPYELVCLQCLNAKDMQNKMNEKQGPDTDIVAGREAKNTKDNHQENESSEEQPDSKSNEYFGDGNHKK